MNSERILAVADAIEQRLIPDLGFNMEIFDGLADLYIPDMSGHNCGTVACIAGWAIILSNRCHPDWLPASNVFYKTPFDKAQYIFDLSYREASELFLPMLRGRKLITDKQAVRTLRHFVTTEIIDFKIGSKP